MFVNKTMQKTFGPEMSRVLDMRVKCVKCVYNEFTKCFSKAVVFQSLNGSGFTSRPCVFLN